MHIYKGQETERTANLVVVENKSTNIEREVDQNVKTIRALIKKLSPVERQKYYNGLLAFIVNEQIELTDEAQTKSIEKKDLSTLSVKELGLLEEMSAKMQQLYDLVGDTE
jgi:hypothetical protein